MEEVSKLNAKFGEKVRNFLISWPWMESWRDPKRVWKFQERFGVQKVNTVQTRPGDHFKVLDHDEWKKYRKDKSNRKEISASASHEPDLRRRTHHRNASNDSNFLSSSGYSSAGENDDEFVTEQEGNAVFYRITNLFWYYFFLVGTQLGDETWYTIMFGFWFWNIDGAVGRRVILMWNLVMYIGQGMKDIIRWPRPQMPPVVQLESKWAMEYGMPSTHSMVGFAIPASILYFTVGRYQYPFWLWLLVAVVWCLLVSTSRIYLGMHSYADIYVGIIFSCCLVTLLLPVVEKSDQFLLSNPIAPLVTLILSLAGVIFYPGSDRWTPARGDTTVILGSYAGVHFGVWCNYQLGIIQAPPIPPPYPILWPSYDQYIKTAMRMMVGGVILIAIRAIVKPLSYCCACYVMNQDMNVLKRQKEDIKNKHKIKADLTYKFVTYMFMGFSLIFVSPIVFQVMGIERPTFYTEA